jgi:menaquinone-9 beta-reductase
MSPRTVEIIGGGLAGLSLGLGLRARGVPVRLTEAGTYPRHRVCGEFITGLDERSRRELQLEAILAPARAAHRVSWFEPGRPVLRHTLPEPALCLSRHRMDSAMAEAFLAAGGELQANTRATPEAKEGRVLACGRHPESSSRWIGLKQHVRDLPLHDDLELHLGRHAYVGLTRVEDDVVNVCGLFPRPPRGEDASLAGRLRAVGLTELADRLASAHPLPDSACAVAGLDYSYSSRTAASLGDHQGLIPPFTGHGMTLALQSAALALNPLEAWSRGHRSWDGATAAMQKQRRLRLRPRIIVGRWLHPWLLSPGRRRIIHGLHRWHLLPFGLLYRLCH